MTRIDGIIILDPNGKPIITSHFPTHPPSYPSIHIDAFNHALKLSRSAATNPSIHSGEKEIPPILWVNTLSRSENAYTATSGVVPSGSNVMSGAGLCHLEREGLRFLVPIGHEVNPLFAFSFLESFLETLKEYLGEITEVSLKDNFDIVYMLIEEMLDEGHPMTMETNMLKEIVLPPTLMRKILNVAGVSGLQTPTTAPFTAPIPWRKPNVRHANNEIYFDIEESLDAIVDRRGHTLSSHIYGRINCNSRLSANPDLILSFTNPKTLSNCAFHPCIRYKKWEKDGVLSFIPPDGKFRLLEYESPSGTTKAGRVPVGLKADMKVEEYGGKFSLTLSSRSTHRPIEDIIISIYLGKGTTSVSATATGDRRISGPTGPGVNLNSRAGLVPRGNSEGSHTAEGGVGGGNWEYDPHTQVLKWTLSSLVANERSPTLTGSFVSSEQHPLPSPSFSVSYSINHYTYSNLKVDQLRVQGDVMYKPFKGVRMMAKAGKVEVRW